jgi:hypothetical protein
MPPPFPGAIQPGLEAGEWERSASCPDQGVKVQFRFPKHPRTLFMASLRPQAHRTWMRQPA